MRGKFTGALGLIGVGILLKNPKVHDALNRLVEECARKAGAWFPKLSLLRRMVTTTADRQDSSTEVSSEKQSPALETNGVDGMDGMKLKKKKPSAVKANRATTRKAPRAKATQPQRRSAPGA